MTSVGLIMAAAAIAIGLALRTRLPTSALAIVAGLLLQVFQAPVDDSVVRNGLVLAATFLVFSVGAQVERRPLRGYRPIALRLTILNLAVTGAIGAIIWGLTDMKLWTAVYWVTALSASSTLLAYDLLRRRERLFEPIGRLVTATSLMQDLLTVILITAFVLASPDAERPEVVMAGLGAVALGGWAISRWLAPRVFARQGLDDEERLLFILLILFGFSALSRATGGMIVTGAWFAGLALSRFPVGDLSRGYLKSFSDFFSIVFYVTLGLLVSIPSPRDILPEIVFVVAIVVARPLLLIPFVHKHGLTWRGSIEATMLLAQSGELAVITALTGYELGLLHESTLGAIISVVVFTKLLAPWLSSDRMTWRLLRLYGRREGRAPANPERGHVIVVGFGETGRKVMEGLRVRGLAATVIDADPAIVAEARRAGFDAIFGDIADADTLANAGASDALAFISTLPRLTDATHLLRTADGRPVIARAGSDADAAGIRALGGVPVQQDVLAAEALFERYSLLTRSPLTTLPGDVEAEPGHT